MTDAFHDPSEALADNLAKQSDMDRIKRPWSPEEDDSLQKLVQKIGPRNWSLISKSIPGRSGKSCRLRWINHLSPQVEHGAFTPEEDDLIIRAHARFGNKWATIARLLNGRTDNAIKNHWNSTLKLKLPADNLAKPNSEENIPLVTLDVAPNDVEEEQVPYAGARESEAPADNLAKPNSEESIFLVTSLCMEILSAACDQASSPSRPRYALFGMLLAIAALLTCICELIYKGRKNKVVWRKMGCCMLFGSVIELYGLVGGITQCVCSIIQYVYYIRRDDNPIKLSLLPAIFLICLIATRLSRKQMQTTSETGEHTA
ncbi:transcription factor MYB25-like isoform X2 [Malus sylvestris]|uniref:transcription factor MYB25-like isoform X2 n=1 Tax=Malus sylvestris TaxID=3752 RepID=UPI0021ACFAE3|nr:transcription factor MYB25-like isoform X2 [Malus sylvestris]